MRRITIDLISDTNIIIYSQQDEIKELPNKYYIGQIGRKVERYKGKSIEESIPIIKQLMTEMDNNRKRHKEIDRKTEG